MSVSFKFAVGDIAIHLGSEACRRPGVRPQRVYVVLGRRYIENVGNEYQVREADSGGASGNTFILHECEIRKCDPADYPKDRPAPPAWTQECEAPISYAEFKARDIGGEG